MKAAAIRCELVASRLARNSEWYTPGIQAAMYLGKCANNAALVCRTRGSNGASSRNRIQALHIIHRKLLFSNLSMHLIE